MKAILPVLLSVLLLNACANSKSNTRKGAAGQTASNDPKLPKEFVDIAELEDRRSLGDGSLATWALTANDPAVRGRALLALGRIQDPTTADTLIKGLTDPDEAARGEAVFAVGLMGLSWVPLEEATRTKLVDAVKSLEAEEAAMPVKLSALESLGRLGGPGAVDRLVDRLSVAGEVQARAALSLGVAAKMGTALPARAFPPLALLVKKEAAPTSRYGSAYALAQSKSASARTWLLVCAADDASEIRAICAKGLGDVGSDIDAVPLKKLLDDPDYRVAVEATRSLAKLAAKCKGATCAPVGALGDIADRIERLVRGDSAGGGQPLLALAQQGLPMSGRPLFQSLRAELLKGASGVKDPKILHDIATIECRIAAAMDKQSGTVTESLNCGGGLISEPQRLSTALHELASAPPADPAKRVQDVGSYVFHSDARVKTAAIDALGESKSPTAMEKIRTQLANQDLIVAASAATAASKLGDKSAIPAIRALAGKAISQVDIAPSIAEALATLDAKEAIPDLEPWLKSTHATIRASAAEALTRLKGSPVVAARVERPADNSKLPNLPKDAKLVVKTEKGEFEVALFTKEAPRNALNMYTLARKNFFKNLTFHRVVPDFVAQGGDPRGDGEGGPGYTIRCEVNRRPYVRGAVGIALSGKDTGGSQFFVTASPQPHLDGRYTNFGEIIKGQEVVDALLEGDKILEVRAQP